jgi:hypothetical protein
MDVLLEVPWINLAPHSSLGVCEVLEKYSINTDLTCEYLGRPAVDCGFYCPEKI